MRKRFKSQLVMAYLVRRAPKFGINIENATKFQKLLFLIYCACLTLLDYRITDESPETGKYGPIFPSTLAYWRDFGVYRYQLMISIDDELDEDVKELIDQVLEHFKDWSANQLVNLTAAKNSAHYWTVKYWKSDGDGYGEQIPDSSIVFWVKNKIIKWQEDTSQKQSG